MTKKTAILQIRQLMTKRRGSSKGKGKHYSVIVRRYQHKKVQMLIQLVRRKVKSR